MLSIVPKLADLMDEPLADASLIPTYLLSKFTRQHVTVAVGGMAATVFLGYPTFPTERLYQRFWRWQPRSVAASVGGFANRLPTSFDYFSLDF